MPSFPTANIISGFRAGADLSASTNRYTAVKIAADGDIETAGANSMDFIGFLQNLPASGGACEIAVGGGGSKAISGGSITAGDRLTTDANGALVTITTGQTKMAAAIALEGAASGDIFAVFVLPGVTHTEP